MWFSIRIWQIAIAISGPQITIQAYGFNWLGNTVIQGYGATHIPPTPGRCSLQINAFVYKSFPHFLKHTFWLQARCADRLVRAAVEQCDTESSLVLHVDIPRVRRPSSRGASRGPREYVLGSAPLVPLIISNVSPLESHEYLAIESHCTITTSLWLHSGARGNAGLRDAGAQCGHEGPEATRLPDHSERLFHRHPRHRRQRTRHTVDSRSSFSLHFCTSQCWHWIFVSLNDYSFNLRWMEALLLEAGDTDMDYFSSLDGFKSSSLFLAFTNSL